jgi:hypothetical protein
VTIELSAEILTECTTSPDTPLWIGVFVPIAIAGALTAMVVVIAFVARQQSRRGRFHSTGVKRSLAKSVRAQEVIATPRTPTTLTLAQSKGKKVQPSVSAGTVEMAMAKFNSVDSTSAAKVCDVFRLCTSAGNSPLC